MAVASSLHGRSRTPETKIVHAVILQGSTTFTNTSEKYRVRVEVDRTRIPRHQEIDALWSLILGTQDGNEGPVAVKGRQSFSKPISTLPNLPTPNPKHPEAPNLNPKTL